MRCERFHTQQRLISTSLAFIIAMAAEKMHTVWISSVNTSVSDNSLYDTRVDAVDDALKTHTTATCQSNNHKVAVASGITTKKRLHGHERVAKRCVWCVKGKGKGFPYSIPSVGRGADPGVQAVSLQVTVSHPPGGRLPLLSARPAVTSPAAEHHRLWLLPS